MIKHKQQKFVDKCFKNKDGELLLWQKPNLPLYLWFISLVILKILYYSNISGNLVDVLELLKFGFIFVWAWLEIVLGENYFRRFLGIIILIFIIYGKISG